MTAAARALRASRRGAWMLACALLAGCAALAPTDDTRSAAAPDASFALSGRMSARHGSDALAAGVQWTHTPADDTLDLASPLGQTLARMTRTANGVAVELADGRRSTAPTFAALTTTAFGVPIPVDGLAWWIRALPHPGSAYRGERDAAGRLRTLDQDGWTLAYSYPDDTPPAALPRLVTLAYPDTSLRIVIDAWH